MKAVHLSGLSFSVSTPESGATPVAALANAAPAASGASGRNRHPRRRHAGQGMTEYIVIVALIAVAAIGIYTLFGQTIRNQTAGLALEVSGQDAATAIGNAQTNANNAQTNANTRKGLDNYNATNRP